MFALYLAEYIDESTVDPASTCHNTVTRELRQWEKTVRGLSGRNRCCTWRKYILSRYLVCVLLHAEVGAAMLHKHVRLHKGLRVQQQLHPFPGRQLSLQHRVSTVNTLPRERKTLCEITHSVFRYENLCPSHSAETVLFKWTFYWGAVRMVGIWCWTCTLLPAGGRALAPCSTPLKRSMF